MLRSVYLWKGASKTLRLSEKLYCCWSLTRCNGRNDRREIFPSKVINGTWAHIYGRQFITFTKKMTFVPKHAKDGVPKDYDVVYENSLKTILGPCRIISSAVGLLTAVSSLSSLAIHWPTISDAHTVGLGAVAVVTLQTVVLVNALSMRYLLRIYFSEKFNAFIAVRQNLLIGSKKIKYSPADIKPPPVIKNINYDKTNVKIFDYTFHLKAQDFILPKYFNMHTGQVLYDKGKLIRD